MHASGRQWTQVDANGRQWAGGRRPGGGAAAAAASVFLPTVLTLADACRRLNCRLNVYFNACRRVETLGDAWRRLETLEWQFEWQFDRVF